MAEASTNSPVAGIENLLKCPICLETLNDPRTLPCLHSFCLACLEAFVKNHRVREKGSDKVVEDFKCPICKSVFRLGINEEVVNMSANHFIRSSLEILSIQRQAKTKIATCATFQCRKRAIGRCIPCELFLCDACSKFHDNWPSFKDHTVLLLSELAECTFENQAKLRVERKTRCEKHKNKTLKFYCETCEALICRYCMDFVHIKQGHSCVLTADVAEKKKQTLKTSYEILAGNLNEGTEALQVVSSAKQCLQQSLTIAKNKVSQHKQEILKQFTDVLDQEAKNVIMELDLEYNENIVSLDKQADTLNSYLEKVKVSVDLTKNLIHNGGQEDIVSSQKMIQENMERLKEGTMKPFTGVPGGKIHIKIKPLRAECISAAFGDGLAKVAISDTLHGASEILKDGVQFISLIEEWMGDIVAYRLCYRATRDGWGARDFHVCCDNKGPTVTLVKVGRCIFGGYTDQDWEGSGVKQSTTSFLFSLRNRDNLPPFKATAYRNPRMAVYTTPSFGPVFGSGPDLFICDRPNINLNSYTQFGGTYKPPRGYYFGHVRTNSLLAGSSHFTADEIEVFY